MTAGFLRRSVFKAFFSYLIGDGQNFSQTIAADSITVNSNEHTRYSERPNNNTIIGDSEISSGIESAARSTSFVDTTAPRFNTTAEVNPAITAPLHYGPSSFSMLVTIGNRETALRLPNSSEFMNFFQSGLRDHFFNIEVKEPPGRSIYPEKCYEYYLRHPNDRLHTQYNMLEPMFSAESNKRNNWTDPTRHQDKETLMKRAEDWLKEVVHHCHLNAGFDISEETRSSGSVYL